MATLAAVLGHSVSTTQNGTPSAPMLSLPRNFLTGQNANQEAAEAEPPTPPAATQAPANGAIAVPLEPVALKALKATRRATPLTSHTLAGQLGLARALAGEAVSAAA